MTTEATYEDLYDTSMMCSWIFTDILGRTHVCDQEEGHYATRPHDCHCGYRDDAGWNADDHCQGHESVSGPAGISTYCDGSCVK